LSINSAYILADPINADRFYAYNPGNGQVLASGDGGLSFSLAGTLAAGGSRLIRAAPGREGDIWVALNAGGLARSTDGGANFSHIETVGNVHAVGFGRTVAGGNYPTVFIWGTVDGVRGVHRSTDTGTTWVRINDDQHQYGGPGNAQIVTGDANFFGRVYMSTVGRGIVYGALIDEEPVSTEESQIAARFELEQNYPNPFNPSTTIRYALPEASRVTLTVYDALGRQISVLVRDDIQAAGRHEITFDAGNLPSGMYLYRLEAGAFSRTGKMMLIK
jgi:hypothetical protein